MYKEDVCLEACTAGVDKDMRLLLKWTGELLSILGTDINCVNDVRDGVYVDSTQSMWIAYTLPEMQFHYTRLLY